MSTNHLHTPEEGVADAHDIFIAARAEHPEWGVDQHMNHLQDIATWLTVLDFIDARKAMPGWLAEPATQAAA